LFGELNNPKSKKVGVVADKIRILDASKRMGEVPVLFFNGIADQIGANSVRAVKNRN
jgi:hypothetical protein